MQQRWVFPLFSHISAPRIFEAIGLDKDLVDKYFPGTVSRIEGISLKDIEDDIESWHATAFDPLGLGVDLTLDSVGAHKERSGKEEHLYNPLTIHMLQEATRTGNYELFEKNTQRVFAMMEIR